MYHRIAPVRLKADATPVRLSTLVRLKSDATAGRCVVRLKSDATWSD